MYWSLYGWDAADPCNVLEGMQRTHVIYWSVCEWDGAHPYMWMGCNPGVFMNGIQWIHVKHFSLCGRDAAHPCNVLESLWMGCSASLIVMSVGNVT